MNAESSSSTQVIIAQWPDIAKTHRALQHLNTQQQEGLLETATKVLDALPPLLKSQHPTVNQYMRDAYDSIRSFLETLPDSTILALKGEYSTLLQQQNGKYNSLVAAFPELATRQRLFEASNFTDDKMTTYHLAYMILGGFIGRMLSLVEKTTSVSMGIYDPDNTITHSVRSSGAVLC